MGSGSGFVECVVGTEIGGEFPVRTGWRGEAPPDRLTIMMPIMVKSGRKRVVESGFWKVAFNDVILVVTPEEDMFNATKLLPQIC